MTQDKNRSSLPRWWDADSLARRLPFLRARQNVMANIRTFFAARDFLEVETPALQCSPGLEPHLKAFRTVLEDPDGGERTFYLHTSPEFAMKKLLAGGLPRLFQIARVFRNGERSDTHHPEFTMLEWYRAQASYTDLMVDVEELFTAVGILQPVSRLTVQDAFLRYAGIDLLSTVSDPSDPAPPPDRLRAEASRIGVYTGAGDRWDDVFFHIFLDRIEPSLGCDGPVILYDWPASMAALSRRSAVDPRVCERFEVYLNGVELANAFGELTDAAEQRRRFEHDMGLKQRLYGVRYPIDEAFMDAVSCLPECAGIALGVDRLVMAVAGASRITDVLWSEVD
ncbi:MULTISPECIES: EF-P lysine aminoacylase EpmA [unclassified Haematospirillum]|uniref:EF-P lysine aminoacylase EpmA n=1 Tax=unclassified Haematospirillum TaxID=2622088 RepID=UPI001438EF70|nr:MULTISPECIES: EF-P lysine aminoacylase EpmA [unclassified Haematospirillum]NKD54098.1 EF-P lysine aminoacylase GenX [Haematospirillum sp. H4890]NKD74143.1 EF-P lysine aminoacylase GenX [Haematospirillum sp. H4485]